MMLAAAAMTTTTMSSAAARAAAPAAPGPSIRSKRSPVASLRSASRRAPRTLRVAARAAAGGKAYICNDCGWIYVPSVEGTNFEDLDRFKCPVCSAPRRRFSPYGGAASGKGVNDNKSRLERKAKLQGGGGVGAAAGNRQASGEGVDSSDAGKLVAAIVGAVAVAGALYAVLNASL